MEIIIGSDHRGFEVKEGIKNYLSNKNIKLTDIGTFSKKNVDFVDIAVELSKIVVSNKELLGILICGSGIGMSIAANKIKGARAALCFNKETAKISREHNNSNIICLSSDNISLDDNIKIIEIWLNTKFSEIERYNMRNEKLDNL